MGNHKGTQLSASSQRPAFTSEHTAPNVCTVRFDTPTHKWDGWLLVSADQHLDHPHCNRKLFEKHLQEAKDRGGAVLIAGDLLCVMQGKYDKRADKAQVHPKLWDRIEKGQPYLDAVVEDAANFLTPYAANIAVIGDGNHEAAIYARHETDLLERLCGILNARTGSKIQHSGYTGWMRLMVRRQRWQASRSLWFNHGYGGGGPVTQDMIQAQRQRAYITADIMVNGHTHDAWCAENIGMRLNAKGLPERRTIHQIKTPTYKEEYLDGRHGWHVATGKPPKPLGGWWVKLSLDNDELKTEVQRAA